MLADAFEAFVAALARAEGLDAAATFIEREHLGPRERAAEPVDDAKTVLQEWSQARFGSPPRYEDRAEGPPHERVFFSTVVVDGEQISQGRGRTKKEAERAAAASALELLAETRSGLPARKLSAPVQSSTGRASKKRRP